MFGIRKKQHLTPAQQEQLVKAIQASEKKTSGEIRVYIESKNYLVNPLERAAEVFFQLNMHHTRQRNGVLIYIAVKHREAAIFGDEGIHQQVGQEFWNSQIRKMLEHFKAQELTEGIISCVSDVTAVLEKQFPYDPLLDTNELPDEVVFGK